VAVTIATFCVSALLGQLLEQVLGRRRQAHRLEQLLHVGHPRVLGRQLLDAVDDAGHVLEREVVERRGRDQRGVPAVELEQGDQYAPELLGHLGQRGEGRVVEVGGLLLLVAVGAGAVEPDELVLDAEDERHLPDEPLDRLADLLMRGAGGAEQLDPPLGDVGQVAARVLVRRRVEGEAEPWALDGLAQELEDPGLHPRLFRRRHLA